MRAENIPSEEATLRVSKQTMWFLGAVFAFLFALLFLGDGPSSYVDVVGAAGTIILVMSTILYLRPLRTFPSSLLIPWSLFLFYIGSRIIFSIDVGFSIRSFLRYIDALLLYYVFYVYLPARTEKLYTAALSVFGFASLIATLVFFSFPVLREWLPSMNLLWSSAGHNHVADLLLLVFLPTLAMTHKHPKSFFVSVALFITMFVFFQGRMSLVVAAVVVVWFLVLIRSRARIGRRIQILIISTCAFATIALIVVSEISAQGENLLFFRRKTSVTNESRLEYWRQASGAILERPLFGSGPGTFQLLSTRLQQRPAHSSWFAHNFILEITAELGIVGVALFVWVFVESYGKLLKDNRVQPNNDILRIALRYTPAVIFLYGLVDFSLNYFVIWALVWTTIGAITVYES